jgi:hypothetical protein
MRIILLIFAFGTSASAFADFSLDEKLQRQWARYERDYARFETNELPALRTELVTAARGSP